MTAPTIVQQSPGVRTAGGGTVTLPGATTAGNVVLLLYTGSSGGPNTPAGFTSIGAAAQNATQYATAYVKTTTGGETSFGVSSGDWGQWVAYELNGATGIATIPQSGGFTSPLVVDVDTLAPGKLLFWTTEQDDGSAMPVAAGTGYTVDFANTGSSGGNHSGAMGQITATSGTVDIPATMSGNTNVSAVFAFAGFAPELDVSVQEAQVAMVQTPAAQVSVQEALVSLVQTPVASVAVQEATVSLMTPPTSIQIAEQVAFVAISAYTAPPPPPAVTRRRSSYVF